MVSESTIRALSYNGMDERMTTNIGVELNRSEAFVLEVLASAEREFGRGKVFTGDAVALLADRPVAGSLGMLVSYGLARRVETPDGYAYSITTAGRVKAMPRG
jgi:hypothetical protein